MTVPPRTDRQQADNDRDEAMMAEALVAYDKGLAHQLPPLNPWRFLVAGHDSRHGLIPQRNCPVCLRSGA